MLIWGKVVLCLFGEKSWVVPEPFLSYYSRFFPPLEPGSPPPSPLLSALVRSNKRPLLTFIRRNTVIAVIAVANHNKHRQTNELIRTRSKYMLARGALIKFFFRRTVTLFWLNLHIKKTHNITHVNETLIENRSKVDRSTALLRGWTS